MRRKDGHIVNEYELRRRLGMTSKFIPEANLVCLSLRLVVDTGGLTKDDTGWADVWELDEDGQARNYPLTIDRLDRWMAQAWEAGT